MFVAVVYAEHTPVLLLSIDGLRPDGTLEADADGLNIPHLRRMLSEGSNTTFDPENENAQGWYWYSSHIEVPALGDEAGKARLIIANVHWPVTAGAKIDFNLAMRDLFAHQNHSPVSQ